MDSIKGEKDLRMDFATIRTLKGIFDFIVIASLTTSVILTVITASDDDSRLGEFIPIILGTFLFPITLYIFQGIQTVVKTIKESLVLRKRHVDALSHIDSTVGRGEDDGENDNRKCNRFDFMYKGEYSICFGTFCLALDGIMLRYSHAKLSIAFMMQNSCLTLLFLDSLKLILWYVTLTYWRREDHSAPWDFSATPLSIYKLHYAVLSLTNTELCLFLLGTAEATDVFCSFEFWINMLLMPPVMFLLRTVFFRHLSVFQLYWMLGFIIWIKHFLILDKTIHSLHNGIARRTHRTFKIVFGIFIMTNAFASFMYILQGVHPKLFDGSPFAHTFSQYGELFYFSLITFSTVGYGDVTPLTIQAKLVAVCFIVCMLVWIPYEMNNFIQGVDSEKEISGHLYFWGSMQSFIVLIGDVDPIQLSLFISKIYYSGMKLKIILLSNLSVATYDVQINQAKILRVSLCIVKDDPGINGNVDILHSIKAKDAVATYVLSSFKKRHARKTDMKTVGRLISLKKFGLGTDTVITQYCSPIRPQIAYRSFGSVVNLYRFKSAIIAKNITCPGIITLIINLSLTHSSIVQRTKGDELYNHYVSGIGKRLRTIAVPERLLGISFDTLCSNLYNIHGYITIGVIHGITNYRSFQLNPSGDEYIIKQGDRAVLVADSGSTTRMDQEMVTASRTSTISLRNTMINMVLQRLASDMPSSRDALEIHERNSSVLSRQNSIESNIIADNCDLQEHTQDANSIVVESITEACRHVFGNANRPIMVIVGYSEFVLQLLMYFQEVDDFNVVIFGKEVSMKVNIAILQRFKSFLAVIDGDPMAENDVMRAEIAKACYIYVIPSPDTNADDDSDVDLDVQTIVIYRHLKTLLQSSINERHRVNNIHTNIYGLVELNSATNVSYLDDTMWSAWNVLDKRLDPSLSYIHSIEFSRGQFISDEMLYSVTMNTMFIHEDYVLYRIMLDLVSVAGIGGKARGVELVPIKDIMFEFNKRTFGQLFNLLHANMKKIAIGIYRIGNEAMENGVICAPPPNFVIQQNDMVYVISRNEIRNI
ncbi:calcium potassium channel protein [Babesia ovis]|uniref:Calcium potassium channel protein n=1 Tax=Babesia ovis TaxID=5869 RepID=A0A9W5TEC9_BABOV|nr:calcium potassium channel protein [Babesia ovis]